MDIVLDRCAHGKKRKPPSQPMLWKDSKKLKIKRRGEKRWKARLKIKNKKTIQNEGGRKRGKQVKAEGKPKQMETTKIWKCFNKSRGNREEVKNRRN